jgi:hypothetical protein
VLELISVHVPKCAGSSFLAALQGAYGVEGVQLDYDDHLADPASPINIDPDGFFERARSSGYPELAGRYAVHGHFHIDKYRAVTERCRRVTILRDPVDRTVSNYYFWQHLNRTGHTLQDYVLDRRLSLVEFARLPIMRYFYERVMFRGVERELFDYVGSVETLDRDLLALSELLGRPLGMVHANAGPEPESAAAQDGEIRAELTELLRDDIAFYRRWCDL